MAAAAHTQGGYGGVPQSVGREFNLADAGTGIRNRRSPGRLQKMLYRGPERRKATY